MALLIARGDPLLAPLLSSHIFVLQFMDSILDCIKCNVADILFSNTYSHPHPRIWEQNGLALPLEDAVETLPNWIAREDCYPEEDNFKNKRNPKEVYNVLDGLLKGNLERLKSMSFVGFDIQIIEIMMLNISSLATAVNELLSGESIDVAGMVDGAYSLVANYEDHEGILRNLCSEGKLGAALWLREKMIQHGAVPDIVSHNYLLSGLCRSGNLEKAGFLFADMLKMGPFPNCVSFNSYIRGYCRTNNMDNALHLLSSMMSCGVQPNSITCNILAHALCKRGLLEEARKLLGQLVSEDNDKATLDLITSTILMDGYFKNGNVLEAVTIWDEISQQNNKMDVISYNAFIHGLLSNRDMRSAIGAFCQMLKKGFHPDVFTYNILLRGFYKEGKLCEASHVYSIMLMKGVAPDLITYKIIIRGLCAHGDVEKAYEFLRLMLEESMVPDPSIWNCVIYGYGRGGDLGRALFVRDQMLASGIVPNVFTYNALIDAQVKRENLSDAYLLKREMHLNGLFADVVTYNLLIGAACNLGRMRFALWLHDEMLRRGCEPDIVTYTELIRAYCWLCIAQQLDPRILDTTTELQKGFNCQSRSKYLMQHIIESFILREQYNVARRMHLATSSHLWERSVIPKRQKEKEFDETGIDQGMLVWALRDGLAAHIVATDLLVKVDAQAFVQASNNDDLFWR
ncbi:hypothetical protein NL676_021740 [Syzygium grande]|nr:hypothetical protein NL676_021740 [Syzygium grande]